MSTNEIGGTVKITSLNEMDVQYRTPYGEGLDTFLNKGIVPFRSNIFSTSEIKLIDNDIYSQYFIPYINYLSSVIRINDHSEMDVQYRTPYGEGLDTFLNKGIVPFRSNIFSTSEIKLIDNDIYSQYFIPYINYLSSVIRINDHSEMDITYKVVQPPIHTMTVSCIKDTYTRQSRPTLNHGGRPSLLSGISTDGQYITYLQFDLNSIKAKLDSGMALKQLLMLLQFGFESYGDLEIYECSVNDWEEYSITWLTTMPLGQKLYDIEVNNNLVSIDVAQYVINLLENRKTRFTWVLKSDSFLTCFSRESEYPPILKLSYADPNWIAFIDSYRQLCRVIITSRDNRDFVSLINVLDKFLFNSKVLIKKMDKDIQSGSLIRSDWNFVNQPHGTAKIKLIDFDLFSNVIIKQTPSPSNLSSTYHQPNSQFFSTADLNQYKDILSEMVIRSEQNQFDLVSKSLMLRYNIQSLVNILESASLAGNAMIIAHTQNDKPSKAFIEIFKSNIDSIVTIRENEFYDKLSSVSITSPMFPSTGIIRISSYNDKSASVIFRTFEHKDLLSLYRILNNWNDDIQSKLIIEQMKYNLLSTGYINSYMFNVSNNLDSTVNISKILSNKESKSIIRRSDKFDYDGIVNIEKIKDNLISEVIIRKENENNYLGESIIRRSNFTDINSTAHLNKKTDLSSTVNIIHITVQQSEAILRQFDITEIRPTVFINSNLLFFNFESTSTIRRRDFNRMRFTARINNCARYWIPNVHGSSVFRYGNRKLPRKWIRDEY